jgi:hypothetical protein
MPKGRVTGVRTGRRTGKATVLTKSLVDLPKRISAATREAMIDFGYDLVDDLYAVTPVDTGFARSTWEMDEDTMIVSNDSGYINILNEGTSTQAPARFIETTVINNLNKPRIIGKKTKGKRK